MVHIRIIRITFIYVIPNEKKRLQQDMMQCPTGKQKI